MKKILDTLCIFDRNLKRRLDNIAYNDPQLGKAQLWFPYEKIALTTKGKT